MLSFAADKVVLQSEPQLADFDANDGVSLGIKSGRAAQPFHAENVFLDGALIAAKEPAGQIAEELALIGPPLKQPDALQFGYRLLNQVCGERLGFAAGHRIGSLNPDRL